MGDDPTRSPIVAMRPVAGSAMGGTAGTVRAPKRANSAVFITVLALGCLLWAGFAYTTNPDAAEFWAWMPSFISYFGLAAAFPALRPLGTVISASIWIPLVGLLILVLVPLSILVAGVEQGRLPGMPTWSAINYALVVCTVGYVALGLSAQAARAFGGPALPRLTRPSGHGTIVAIFALAYLGALIKVESQGGILAYYSGQPSPVAVGRLLRSLGLLGVFLPALGPMGSMLYWRSRPVLRIRDLGVGLLGVLPLTTFSYNRGSWVFPTVTLILIVLRLRPSLGRPAAVIGLVLLPVLVITVGTVRTQAELRSYNIERPSSGVDVSGLLQVYGNSPQQMAAAMAADPGRPTLLASVMTPVPVLGKPYRDISGPAVWNYALYGTYDVQDQILPLAAELYWIAGLLSVVVGFAVLGLVVGYLTRWTLADADPLRLYLRMLLALWITLGLTWSAAVMVQMIVYFWLIPYLTMRLLRRY